MGEKIIDYEYYRCNNNDEVVKAIQYKSGMEDGIQEIHNEIKPYILAYNSSQLERIFVNENYYIINNSHKFILHKNIFEKEYRRIE